MTDSELMTLIQRCDGLFDTWQRTKRAADEMAYRDAKSDLDRVLPECRSLVEVAAATARQPELMAVRS